jgi:primosomal protein DnaI
MKNFNEMDNPYKKNNLESALKKNYMTSLQNNDFVKLVNSLNVPEETLFKHTSSLERTVEELNNCKGCKGLEYCKNKVVGYVYYPACDNENLNFVYKPCKYKKKEKEETNNVLFFDTPKFLRTAKLSELYPEKERINIIKYIKEFVSNYTRDMKGMYLHGSFGSGKSYIISALLNELSKKNFKCVNVYFPLLLKTLKEGFNEGFDDMMEEILNADALLIDDLGAENNTSWSRDEILGTILQYRMDNNLLTFITSNLNIEELEEHLKTTNKSVDDIKARRKINNNYVSLEFFLL